MRLVIRCISQLISYWMIFRNKTLKNSRYLLLSIKDELIGIWAYTSGSSGANKQTNSSLINSWDFKSWASTWVTVRVDHIIIVYLSKTPIDSYAKLIVPCFNWSLGTVRHPLVSLHNHETIYSQSLTANTPSDKNSHRNTTKSTISQSCGNTHTPQPQPLSSLSYQPYECASGWRRYLGQFGCRDKSPRALYRCEFH